MAGRGRIRAADIALVRERSKIDEIVGEFHELGGPFPEIGENRPSNAHVFDSARVAGFTIEEVDRLKAGIVERLVARKP